MFQYILLMAQGVLAFSSHTGWALSLKYEDKRIIHMVMQISGASLALVGGFIRATDLDSNFQTAHGILGEMIQYIFTREAVDVSDLLLYYLTRRRSRSLHRLFLRAYKNK